MLGTMILLELAFLCLAPWLMSDDLVRMCRGRRKSRQVDQSFSACSSYRAILSYLDGKTRSLCPRILQL
jgi:hypothetical protein